MSLSNNLNFLSGTGEMARLTREYDWSKNDLGKPETWPHSLRTTLSILLRSKFPMFLFWGPDSICFYNDAYRPSLGIEGKHPNAIGRSGKEVWPEIWDFLDPLITKAIKDEESTWNDDLLVPIYRNGKLENVYWTFSFSPVVDELGNVGGVLVVCNETTQKLLTLKQLEISNNRFQNLVHQATVGIILLIGKEMMVEMVNLSYCQLIDKVPEDLIGNPLFDIIPETEEVFRPIIDRVRLSGNPLYLFDQPYFVWVDGEKKNGYLNLVYQPYYEADSTISGVMVVCHDVTQQVISRQKIELEKERTRLAVEAGELGVFEISLLTDEVVTDKRIDEIWGFEKSVSRKEYFNAFLEEDKTSRNEKLKEAYESGSLLYEVRIKRQDGCIRWINVLGQITYDDQHKPFALHGLVTDITEHKQSQENLVLLSEKLAAANERLSSSNIELESTNKQLKKINSDLDNFIYTASHDLKAPINNLEGLFNTLLSEIKLAPDLIDLKTMIDNSFERFRVTVNHLTEITKLQKEEEIPEPVELTKTITEATIDIKNNIEASGAKIVFNLEVPEVKFSAKNLRSIIYNLVSNAIKYRSEARDPVITISSFLIEEYIVLEVADNGLGLSEANIKIIFGMFKRAHAHVEGSGIGLFIVKKMVENAGGKIEVESELGMGSKFKIFLPNNINYTTSTLPVHSHQ